jgi:hypothetical protein
MAISNPAAIFTPVAPAGAASTVAATTNVTIPAGAKVWLVITWFVNIDALSSASDGGTATYTIDHQGANGNNHVAIVQADYPAGLASGATITATFATAFPTDRQMAGFYSTGVQANAAAAYGAIGAGVNTASVWNSGNVTVLNGDILIGASKWEDSVPQTSTPSGGNTEIADWNAGGGYATTATYQIGTGAAIAASGTWSNTSAGTSGTRTAAAANKAAAAAAGGSSRRIIVSREAHRRSTRW